MAVETPAVVSFRDVGKDYGPVAALSGLSLEIGRGSIFSLVGPDGAGKTTALELVCGLRRASRGEIRVFGLDPAVGGRSVASRLGFVSQDFSLYGTLSVEENLDFFADIREVPRREREERKRRLLRFARLERFLERRAEHLSGGMKKKLALCCALVHEPELLVLDEPTTGVDPVSRRELWEIVSGFLETGITVVVTTPYMDEAEQCHRVGLLAEGTLIACGTPDELRATVEGEVLLVRGRPIRSLEERARETLGVLDVTSFGDRLHVRVRPGGDFLAAFRAKVERGDASIEELRRIEPTLEDVFLARSRNPGTEAVRDSTGPLAVFGAPRAADGAGTVVRAEGLVRRFGDFAAVDGIDVAAGRGEIFGFLGPNGAGKTTTIRMLCGLLEPSEGKIRVAGVDVVAEPRRLRPKIGYMSQHFSLYPDLTVAENLELFGGLYGVPPRALRERMRWVVGMAGLEGRERWLSRELSGGWKQRLALGAALLHDPEVLFLDEPTSGVDPASRKRFWELIYALAERGTTVFVTTHYMDEAEHCHRLALVYRGRIIARNSPHGLRRDMRAGELLEIECDRPLQALRAAKAEPYVWEASLFGKTVHVVVDEAERDRSPLERALASGGISVRRMERVALSLEDLFVLFIAMQDQRVKEAARA